jgi:hypothetical protein
MPRDFEILKEPMHGPGSTDSSYGLRRHNIDWVRRLDRTDLIHGKFERQILLYLGKGGESLYLGFPGKESEPTLPLDKLNPDDFRPKLVLSDGVTYARDLAFFELWASLEKSLAKFKGGKNLEIVSALICLIYRMAFMCDHRLTESPITKVRARDLSISGGKETYSKEQLVEIGPYYKYAPDKNAVNKLSLNLPELCGMPFDSFINYIECLAWNEDCKYDFHWRNPHTKSNKKRAATGKPRGKWMGPQGRVNFLLTVIHFIALVTGDLSLSEAFGKFAMNGVAPVDLKLMPKITGGLVSSREKKSKPSRSRS